MNLLATDVGRLITDIRINVDASDLQGMITDVIDEVITLVL